MIGIQYSQLHMLICCTSEFIKTKVIYCFLFFSIWWINWWNEIDQASEKSMQHFIYSLEHSKYLPCQIQERLHGFKALNCFFEGLKSRQVNNFFTSYGVKDMLEDKSCSAVYKIFPFIAVFIDQATGYTDEQELQLFIPYLRIFWPF